jgi:CheY-like chemotaxis protein
MVTAHEELFMKAFNDGCDDYILKPIDPPVLFQKIEKVLAQRKRKSS